MSPSTAQETKVMVAAFSAFSALTLLIG